MRLERKSNRKWRWCILFCVIVLLVGIGVKLTFDHYFWGGGWFISRTAQQLDLTNRELTLDEYNQIQETLPDCDILWNVPFQGQYVRSDTKTISVSSLTEEDVSLMAYFPNMTMLDAENCTDYSALMAFRARYPECGISYQVSINGTLYQNDITELTIEDPSVPELTENLPHLTELTALRLSGQMPEVDALLNLQDAYPNIHFVWEVPFQNSILDSTITELDLSGIPLEYDTVAALLEWFPQLQFVNMRDCGLTDTEMMTLADTYSQCFFLWDITVANLQFSTDAEEIDISYQQLQSTEEVEAYLPYFPNLTRVVMSRCGIDDETMDALNQRYEDIRFIWSVNICGHYIRTDTTYFYPYKLEKDLEVYTEALYPLRYCTDIICVDIGHMTRVKNCDWAAYMPHLKYLIIGETGITDLSPLSNCKELVYLEMFITQVTDYSPLLECTALEDLNLGETYGDPEPLTKMTWLKNLWWYGVHGTYGRPCSNAKAILEEALPNTNLKFIMKHSTDAGWRRLDNYYAMRDCLGMFYLP